MNQGYIILMLFLNRIFDLFRFYHGLKSTFRPLAIPIASSLSTL